MSGHPRPWHRGSRFGDGPRCPLDRERRARFKFLLHAHRAAGRLTADYRDIGEALLRRLGADGRCDPSYATLATDTGASDRTARRATAALRDLGLLRWQRRLIRRGWRAEQTSNAYELVSNAAAPLPGCGGQAVPGISRKILLPADMGIDIAAAQAALAKRRTVVEGRLLMNGSGTVSAT